MPAEIATDYALARATAEALANAPALGLAAVLLGGVGDDWLRAPVYPYAVVAPAEAETARGSTTRTVRVLLVARGEDAATKPDPATVGYSDWTFADGLLEAARANISASLVAPTRLGFDQYNNLCLLGADGMGVLFAECTPSADTLSQKLSVPYEQWVTTIVPVGGTVATRAARQILLVGPGAALDVLVAGCRDLFAGAPPAALGAPLASIGTTYDAEPAWPVARAELLLSFEDPQAFSDAF